MNFTQNDNPLLVAPRPVRLTSAHMFARTQPVRLVSAPTDQFERVKITDDDGIDDLKVGLFCDSTTGSSMSDKDLASPRASPRSVPFFSRSNPTNTIFLSICLCSDWPFLPKRSRNSSQF